jgi:protoporphyrinogen oxidase
MQAPVARRLIPEAPAAFLSRLESAEYLGIVCPLFVMTRPLTGLWTLNLADPGILFTGVIETTSYIDPSLVGGHHLVYVPKYVAAGSEWLTRADEDVTSHWIAHLERFVPGFDRAHVRDVLVHRERYVEPLHPVGRTETVPPVETPVNGLFLATTAQIYPALTNGESVTRHASAVAARVVRAMPPGART